MNNGADAVFDPAAVDPAVETHRATNNRGVDVAKGLISPLVFTDQGQGVFTQMRDDLGQFLKYRELQAHIQNTRHRYNMPALEKRIDRARHRVGIADQCDDPIPCEVTEPTLRSLL